MSMSIAHRLNFPRLLILQLPSSALNPGGSLELIDIIYPLTSDDGTLKPHHAVNQWSVLLNEGFGGNERPLDTALKYKEQLAAAGFVDIVEIKEKWPINGWARDKKYKQVGMHFKDSIFPELEVADCEPY